MSNGTFLINDCLITNNISNLGGGITVQSELNMLGGTISNNTARQYGGAININNSSIVNISNAKITNNYANLGGGGLHSEYSTEINISNSAINENTSSYGGGISIGSGSKLNLLENNYITNNIAYYNGGGIYAYEYDILINIENINYITNNIAYANGGGIYLDNENYNSLTTSNSTTFSKNKAIFAFFPPENALELYPNIDFINTSITDHPINNYDINYFGNEIIVFNITYDANGGIGKYIGSNIHPYQTDTVLSIIDTEITNDHHTFLNWNTNPDGSGTTYLPNDILTLSNDITLYAIWELNTYIVTFDSNGGTLVDSETVSHNQIAPEPNSPTKFGYEFAGWYTDNGTFFNRWNFNNPINQNLTLYAKWITTNSLNIISFISIYITCILIICTIFFNDFIKCLVNFKIKCK